MLDAGAHLKAFRRMDGAVLASIDIAIRKASTAVLFQANSEALWEYCKPGAPAPGLQLTNGGLVFTSSMGDLFTPANWGVYVSTKRALESVAEALQQELRPHEIAVQTINPGAFYTGYNETMADAPFRWLDDSKHITERAALRKEFRLPLRAGGPPGRPPDDRPYDRDRSR